MCARVRARACLSLVAWPVFVCACGRVSAAAAAAVRGGFVRRCTLHVPRRGARTPLPLYGSRQPGRPATDASCLSGPILLKRRHRPSLSARKGARPCIRAGAQHQSGSGSEVARICGGRNGATGEASPPLPRQHRAGTPCDLLGFWPVLGDASERSRARCRAHTVYCVAT